MELTPLKPTQVTKAKNIYQVIPWYIMLIIRLIEEHILSVNSLSCVLLDLNEIILATLALVSSRLS